MNTQVHLNPTELSIISIPRDRYWIFTSSILQLLYNEVVKYLPNYNVEDYSDSEEEYDEDNDENSSGDENDTDDDEEHYSRDRRHRPHRANLMKNVSYASNENDSWSTASNKRSSVDSHHQDENPGSGGGGHRRSVDNSSKMKSNNSSDSLNRNYESDQDSLSEFDNYFFHIALTPLECTVIVSTSLLTTLFKDPIEICRRLDLKEVQVISESFLSLQVDSDGSFDNSLRILELTKPLSENNISLFFLSSHFSDIVLFPASLKEKVISILTKKNFEFSDISNSYIMSNTESNEDHDMHSDEDIASKILEEKTFKLFSDANIKPAINTNEKLLLTGARAGEVHDTILNCATVLARPEIIPPYFAITRTSINEVSLILPKSSKKRAHLGFDSKSIIGSTQDIIIPISIDFSNLPLDSTGIVAGVASKLINGIKKYNNTLFEMNYFSMARSGIIMIPQENVETVSDILNNIDYNDQEKVFKTIPDIASLAL
ncbi:hypothetical protein G9P44_005190 [Scheffersomyces stipitis]|nr:hypothetical protein G9P44_005190 [Scheffersomyces stipitis]